MGDWASTQRVTGEISFSEGSSLEGEIHLQVGTATRASVETPLEMLNRPEKFFPVALEDGSVRLVAKAHVTVVSFASDAPETPHLEVTEPQRLDVYMADGSEHSGDVYIELGPLSPRDLDFLNEAEPFFALSGPDGILYLNRSHVKYVRPHD